MTRPNPETILATALGWHRAGAGAALVSVLETWGSAPCPVGSVMAVSGTGQIAGSVSGGCVEGAVVTEAQAALADGGPRILTYGVSDDDAFAARLACGGTIRLLVEPVGATLPEAMLADLVAARANRRALAYRVNLSNWQRHLDPPGPALHERFAKDRSGIEGDEFIAIHNPSLRLVIIGAVHIAQPLVAMAQACGYAPLIIDPREAFGSADRFPDSMISHDWPETALARLRLDARSALVALSHDAKFDDPALGAAMGSPAFYIGALGSRRSHAARLQRLGDAGFSAEQLARIHAPVGLNIGAQTAPEIAVAIMAEITQTLRRNR